MRPKNSSMWLCWATSLLKVRGDSDCDEYRVLSLEVGKVTLSNGQTAKGVAIEVGNPAQAMAFLPQMPLNNSFVYGTAGYCNAVTSGWSDDGCITFRGGAYEPTESSSMQEGAGSAFATDTGTYPDLDQMLETVILDSFTLEEFPIGIALNDWGEQGYYPQAALGLGPNSTLLSTLVDSGSIASRTFSWFWGLEGGLQTTSTQLNGSLVLGGYDKAKVSGTGYTSTITTSSGRCTTGLFMTLSDVIVNMVDGTSSSLFATDSTLLAACIDPGYPSLTTIPLDPYWNKFQTITGATITGRSVGLNWYNMRYDADQTTFTGDMTLQFASGLSIQIENSQYIGPDITINQTTGALESNDTEPDVALIALQSTNADDVIRIGRNFFSGAYLMVNYDAGEFTIWPANPTADQDLVAVDSTGVELTSLCSTTNKTATATAGSTTPSTTDETTAVETSSSADSNTTLPMAAIIGGVVGGVAGLAALALVLCLVIRRRQAKGDSDVAELDNNHAQSELSSVMFKTESSASPPDTHEVRPGTGPLYELPISDGDERYSVWSNQPPRFELADHTKVHEM